MNPHKIMRFLVLLLILAATAGVTYQQLYRQDWFGFAAPEASVSTVQEGAQNAVKNRVTQRNLFPFLAVLLSKLPSPTNLDVSRFDQVLGIDASNFLRSANVNRIEVNGDLFSVALNKAKTTNLNGQADLRVAAKVTFNYQKVANLTRAGGAHIVFGKIDGVEVNATWILGWMTVSQVNISLDAAGNTVLVVTVDTFFGKTDRTFIIGPDGKSRKP